MNYFSYGIDRRNSSQIMLEIKLNKSMELKKCPEVYDYNKKLHRLLLFLVQ